MTQQDVPPRVRANRLSELLAEASSIARSLTEDGYKVEVDVHDYARVGIESTLVFVSKVWTPVGGEAVEE